MRVLIVIIMMILVLKRCLPNDIPSSKLAWNFIVKVIKLYVNGFPIRPISLWSQSSRWAN